MVEKKEEEFSIKKLTFNYDLSKAKFDIDALQNELLNSYLRLDSRFRHAYHKDFTNIFIQFLKDKVKLHEPCPISMSGNVRAGKSYSAITICVIHQALQGRLFSSEYICPNEYSFLEKLKEMPENKLKDRIFLIDEEKTAVFGVGSFARKMKMEDVANIIAINNISAIRINPMRFPAQDVSWYGLRAFGRDRINKVNRFMLYNLQEGQGGAIRPMGMIYLPIFTAILPKDIGDKLEKEYLAKKNEWVGKEMRGEGDVMHELRKKLAENFSRDKDFLGLSKKNERKVYVSSKLGSEYTSKEIDEILVMANMLIDGVNFG